MPRFHHVNLGVPPGLAEDEGAFLIDVLGYRRVELTPELEELGAIWFEDEHGQQIHLSVDPNHQVADRAHTAIELGDAAAEVEARLATRGVETRVIDRFDLHVVLCQDPAGNRWELRSASVS